MFWGSETFQNKKVGERKNQCFESDRPELKIKIKRNKKEDGGGKQNEKQKQAKTKSKKENYNLSCALWHVTSFNSQKQKAKTNRVRVDDITSILIDDGACGQDWSDLLKAHS